MEIIIDYYFLIEIYVNLTQHIYRQIIILVLGKYIVILSDLHFLDFYLILYNKLSFIKFSILEIILSKNIKYNKYIL